MSADSTTSENAPARYSMPRVLLQVEGLVVLGIALVLYGRSGASWGMFALLLLVPDLSALGYLANVRVGAVTYNLVHTLVLPVGLGAVGLSVGNPVVVQLALIWLAHIGMDRAVGYGFKYASGFKDTHLGRV